MTRRRPVPFARFMLQRLEDRVTPAIVADVPTWRQDPTGGSPGTVSDVAPDPADPNVLFVSGAEGGLWRTRNAQAPYTTTTDPATGAVTKTGGPNWDYLGTSADALQTANATAVGVADTLPSLSIADMSLNPDDPNQLVFGIGDMANGGRLTGDLVGAYFTSNALADQPVFTRLSGPANETVLDSTGAATTINPQGAFVNNLVRSVVVRSLPGGSTGINNLPASDARKAGYTANPVVGYILIGGDAGVYIAYRRADGSVDPFTRISGVGGLGPNDFPQVAGAPDVGVSSDIVPDPSNPRRVYIASNLGLFRDDDLSTFVPASSDGTASATFPAWSDLTPALTAATGQSSGTLLAAIGSVDGAADQVSHQRVRVAVHASTDSSGADVNVLYVAVANPGIERSQYPPDTNSGAPTGPTDSQLSVFYATDQLQKTVTGVSYPTDTSGGFYYFNPTTGVLTTATDPQGTKVQVNAVSYRTDRAGNYLLDGSGSKITASGYGYLRNPSTGALLTNAAGTSQLIAAGAGFGSGQFTEMDEPQQLGPTIGTITDATYANPVALTINAPSGDHGLNTGDRVLIEQQGGNAAPNSIWTVTRTSKTQITLNNSAGTGKFNLSNATIREVYGVATASDTGFAGRADTDIRLAIAADPTNPNLVYIGGGAVSQYGQFVGNAYPTFFGSDIVRGDRSRPRLNGLVTTSLIENDVSYQWTALNGYKAAADTTADGIYDPTPTDAAASYVNLVFGPSVNGQAKLYAATDGGVFVRTNPQSNGRISRTSPASSDANVWSDLNGAGRTALDLTVTDGYFASQQSFTFNGVTTNQATIDFAPEHTLFDPVSKQTFIGSDVDGVTTPGQSIRVYNGGGFLRDQTGALFLGAGTGYEKVNAAGVSQGFVNMTLATPTATAPNIQDSALIAADKTADSRPYLLVRLNQTKPTDPGSVSSGAGRVVIGGFALYEDDEPTYFPGEPGNGNGIGNIVGNITPAGMTGRVSALRYGGRQPGGIITTPDDPLRRIQYVETPRVIYAGTTTGQLFVRGATDGFRQVTSLPGSGVINDVVTDPDDWRIAYVLRGNNQIYRTLDAGLTWSPDLTKFYVDSDGTIKPLAEPLLNSGVFTTDSFGTNRYTGLGTYDSQGNVADGQTTQIFSLALYDGQTDGNQLGFPVPGGTSPLVQEGAVPGFYNGQDTRQDVVLAGGKGGVFRLVSLPDPSAPVNSVSRQDPVWDEFGVGLPNVPVTSVSVNTYYTTDPATGVQTRRAGLSIGTFGRGQWQIGVADPRTTTPGPDNGLYNDITPTAAAATQVGINANDQTTGAASGQPLNATITADPTNTAFVTVTDGLGNSRRFERTVIQGFNFTGTSLADTVTVGGGGDLAFVRFPIRVDLQNTAGDVVKVVNQPRSSKTLVTVDTATETDQFGNARAVERVGAGATDNLFNTAAGGSLTVAGLGSGTLDLNLGAQAGPLASQPADQVTVLGTAAAATQLDVGAKAAVSVGSGSNGLDGLLGNLAVFVTRSSEGTSNVQLTLNDAAGAPNTAAAIGRETRADGQVFGVVTGVGGPGNQSSVSFGPVGQASASVLTLTVNGSNADAAETYTVDTPPAVLNLNTGAGPDTVNVRGLTQRANVNTGAGNDLIAVSSRAGVNDDGDLSGINAPLFLDAGGGDNRLVVSNAGSAAPKPATISGTSITGVAGGAITFAATGGDFRDPLGGPGLLYRGSSLVADQITLAGAPANSQVTVDGQSGADAVTVVGDQLNGADVLVNAAGGDTVTVTQGTFGLAAASLQVVGSGDGNLVVQGFDKSSRVDVASLRVDGNGRGSVLLNGATVATQYSGLATVAFDGLSGRNSLTVIDGTNTSLGSPSDPGSGIVFAPLGESSGTVRLGSLAPLVKFQNVNGSDATGLVIDGDPTGTGRYTDTLTVVGPSETGLGGTGTLAGLTATTADSTITVSDQQVVFERSSAGLLRTVALGRENGRSTISNLVVLAGNQSKQGDQVTVVPSREVNILVDGQGPDRSGPTGNVLTVGSDAAYTLSSTTSAALGGTQTRVTTADGASFGYRNFGRLQGQSGTGRSIYAVGADVGGGPRVRVYDALTQDVLFDQFVFEPSFTGGVRVATGDVTGDGVPDLIVAAGPGGGPLVKVFDGVTFQPISSFYAYEPSFTGGLYVAVGDVAGTGTGQIVTGTGVGGGPLVKVFDSSGKQLSAVFAFESTFRGGVRVAAGDVTGDGRADLVTTAGPGGGPVVRVFDAVTLQPVVEYFSGDPNNRNGLAVAAGDLNGDGIAEIITGPASGPVSSASVRRGADGSFVDVPLFTDQPADSTPADTGVLNDTGGVRLAVADAVADGSTRVFLAARGPGFPSKVYRYFIDPVQSSDPTQAFEDAFVGGVWVG